MGFFFDAMSIVGREYEISKDKCKIMFDAACKSVCRHIFTMVRIFAAGSFDPDACSPIGGNISYEGIVRRLVIHMRISWITGRMRL